MLKDYEYECKCCGHKNVLSLEENEQDPYGGPLFEEVLRASKIPCSSCGHTGVIWECSMCDPDAWEDDPEKPEIMGSDDEI